VPERQDGLNPATREFKITDHAAASRDPFHALDASASNSAELISALYGQILEGRRPQVSLDRLWSPAICDEHANSSSEAHQRNLVVGCVALYDAIEACGFGISGDSAANDRIQIACARLSQLKASTHAEMRAASKLLVRALTDFCRVLNGDDYVCTLSGAGGWAEDGKQFLCAQYTKWLTSFESPTSAPEIRYILNRFAMQARISLGDVRIAALHAQALESEADTLELSEQDEWLSEAHQVIARHAELSGDREKELYHCRQAVWAASNPNNPQAEVRALYKLGHALYRHREFKQAKESFEKVIDAAARLFGQRSDSADLLFIMSKAYLGRLDAELCPIEELTQSASNQMPPRLLVSEAISDLYRFGLPRELIKNPSAELLFLEAETCYAIQDRLRNQTQGSTLVTRSVKEMLDEANQISNLLIDTLRAGASELPPSELAVCALLLRANICDQLNLPQAAATYCREADFMKFKISALSLI